MSISHSRRSLDELCQLGEEILQRVVAPTLTPADNGKFIAIAVDHDDFELDTRDVAAVMRLRERHPGAEIWLERAGRSTAYRIRRVG